MTTLKQATSLALAVLILAGCVPSHAFTFDIVLNASSTHPAGKVLPLIIELRAEVEKDGKKEQKSYDRHQCWCEKTLERKAKDISDEKASIERLQNLIYKLEGELGAHGAEIKQLNKDIAANLESQKEATDVREKESMDYSGERAENEQCIGALESAITVLTGAGAGKKGGFLETLPVAQLLSVASDVRQVLQKNIVWKSTSAKDLEAIRHFVNHPESISASRRKGGLSAAQLGNNPFGDYAPQSTQIQGILKGMYDAFTADLEKDNAEEATKQKAFEEFMATKKAELATLQLTLEKQEHEKATKDKQLADSVTERDDTKAQLKADEIFFEDTKQSCRTVAKVWAERSRLRTEELQGIQTAIEILSSSQADATFMNATNTFLQLKTIHAKAINKANTAPKRAYAELRNLASKYQSIGLAQIAAEMRTGGHFDKVIAMIDHMIELIRKEEADDISHRDRCQNAEKANGNDMADIKGAQEQTEFQITVMGDKAKELIEKITELETLIADTKEKMEERLSLRNVESADFKRALQVDQEAIDILNEAIVALMKFYKKNRIPIGLVQHKQEPEYTINPDKAPELEWEGQKSYEGRKDESHGIIAILSMIAEDYQHEMDSGRADDAKAQQEYEADLKAMTEMLHAQEESHVATETELAELQDKIRQATEFKNQKGAELEEQEQLKETLGHDCEWVKTHFDERRDARKAELDGLAEAKNILAGAAGGDFDELALSTS